MTKPRNSPVYLAAILLVLAGLFCSGASEQQAIGPPPPTRIETVVDTLHGVPVKDPYRWLEDGDSKEVERWTSAQNEYFQRYVGNYPYRDKIESQLNELLSIGYIGTPSVRDSLYFFYKREGQQNHAVLFMRRGLDGDPEVLIDPNLFSDDGTVAMDWSSLSSDGSLIAYGVSASGTENSTLFIKKTSDKAMLPDTIPYTRAASVAWLPDNGGFYYTRYPAPGTVPDGDETYFRRVYFHRLGDRWEEDSLIFGEQLAKTDWPDVAISPDGRRLICGVFMGWSKSEVYLCDLSRAATGFLPIATGIEASFEVIPLNGRFLIRTDYQAPRYRVLSGSYDAPGIENWREIIPERQQILDEMGVIDNHVITLSLKDAHSVLEIYTLDGEFVREVPVPTLSTISRPSGEWDGHELFFTYHSFNTPRTIMRYDFMGDTLNQIDQIQAALDVSNIVVKQIWYNSKDGTPVSMFIVHNKDIALDGKNPTYLYGYGGFNATETPYFSQTMTFWYKQGGVFALPNLRGGGEYGEEWHKAGKLENKQNVFDDFIAAAEYLFKAGYTDPDHLVISGGSNGGLLIGAVIAQRPDICRAAVCAVPLLDMVRYQKFLMAELWIAEYGSSDDPEQFKYIYAYSPYHNVRDGVNYPCVLLKAGASDNRVDPMHARKMAARLQAANASDNPIMLRVETKAGHGQGKPISKRLVELTDTWCFIFKSLGMDL